MTERQHQDSTYNDLVQPLRKDLFSPRGIISSHQMPGSPITRPFSVNPMLGPGVWKRKLIGYRRHRAIVLINKPMGDWQYPKEFFDARQADLTPPW